MKMNIIISMNGGKVEGAQGGCGTHIVVASPPFSLNGPLTLDGRLPNHTVCVCVCVSVAIPSILDIRLVDAPAGVIQEEGRTGFFHLLSAVLALIFLEKNSAVPFPCRP